MVVKLTLLLWSSAFSIMPFKFDLFREAFCGTQGGYSVNLYLIKDDIDSCSCRRRDVRSRVCILPHCLFLGHSDASSEAILKCFMPVFTTLR